MTMDEFLQKIKDEEKDLNQNGTKLTSLIQNMKIHEKIGKDNKLILKEKEKNNEAKSKYSKFGKSLYSAPLINEFIYKDGKKGDPFENLNRYIK